MRFLNFFPYLFNMEKKKKLYKRCRFVTMFYDNFTGDFITDFEIILVKFAFKTEISPLEKQNKVITICYENSHINFKFCTIKNYMNYNLNHNLDNLIKHDFKLFFYTFSICKKIQGRDVQSVIPFYEKNMTKRSQNSPDPLNSP
ncbi:hypothetical protein BpHYR1_019409 [Brachionus plicatilis]|uniref:Uncharacterized protein n=1 Tax=Brachionus plicatilis TaxID=10195 RepID=A0A3M7PEN4_BRAPC|nr:hypothetical protein BpHYR1_019409 [Brachionus plicatilis]